jgi:hypothetical protein
MPAIARAALLLVALSALAAQTTAQTMTASKPKRLSFQITLTYSKSAFDNTVQQKYKEMLAKIGKTTAGNIDFFGDDGSRNSVDFKETKINPLVTTILVFTKVLRSQEMCSCDLILAY